ncbi:MAG TPA: hypothetical protein VGB37_09190 [Candidatus Lokiarchaeia archaeon]
MNNNLDPCDEESYQINRDKIIQLLINEIIFLGKCYQKSKFPSEKKIIKSAGLKLQKLLIKQKSQINDVLQSVEYQALIELVYQIIENVLKKI